MWKHILFKEMRRFTTERIAILLIFL